MACKPMKRSIAGQVEYWATLGRALEPMLSGRQMRALIESPPPKPLSECVRAVGTVEGDEMVRRYLESRPFPHYEPAPGAPGLLAQIEADGTRTIGKFVNREFKAVKVSRK